MERVPVTRPEYPRAGPTREVAARERASYERDGAAVLKGIVALAWVDYMRGGRPHADPVGPGPVPEGSPHWGVVYHPRGFKAVPEITGAYRESPFADQPDFDAEYDQHEWLVGAAEPGDALVHQPRTVHGSPGNTTARVRRVVASIYDGDRVTWIPHPANMFGNKSLTGHVAPPDLAAGGPLYCPLFPRVWP